MRSAFLQGQTLSRETSTPALPVHLCCPKRPEKADFVIDTETELAKVLNIRRVKL